VYLNDLVYDQQSKINFFITQFIFIGLPIGRTSFVCFSKNAYLPVITDFPIELRRFAKQFRLI